jgi:hypothetical protein
MFPPSQCLRAQTLEHKACVQIAAMYLPVVGIWMLLNLFLPFFISIMRSKNTYLVMFLPELNFIVCVRCLAPHELCKNCYC